jgi:hypothetical protein
LFAKLEQRQREVATAIEERPWSMTWRTRHSRSLLGVELHHDDLVIAVVRYQPSARTDTVARLNAALGCDYPLDLPVDVVAALLGFSFDRASDLAPQLNAPAEPETIAGLLLVLSALRHGDLDAMPLWRHYAGHAHATVRATALNIALAYNYESLLEERSLLEPDPEMRAEIEAALDDGIAPPVWDPYPREETGEP